MTLVSVDTNILIYAVDEKAGVKQDIALAVLNSLRAVRSPISLQVIGEFYHVASRKFRIPTQEIAVHARELMVLHRSFSAARVSTRRTIDLAATGWFSFRDANLVSAAEAAGMHPSHLRGHGRWRQSRPPGNREPLLRRRAVRACSHAALPLIGTHT